MRPAAIILAILMFMLLAGCRSGEGPEAVVVGSEEAAIPAPDLSYNAREGRALYRYYCAPCHGEEGHGDGFNAFNLDPKPRDLTRKDFQDDRSDEDLESIIRSGGGAAGLSTGMPPWGLTLNDREIANLVLYLRTLSETTVPGAP